MQSSKGIENELTVGNNFFENIPPVTKSSHLNQLRNSEEVVHTTDPAETRRFQKSRNVLKAQDITVVKGFGGNALFALGLLAREN